LRAFHKGGLSYLMKCIIIPPKKEIATPER
jgi:hypothetical protein